MADSSPFGHAAPYYDAFRSPYAPAALAHVVTEFGIAANTRVLDLGCGPGTIAIPLSRTGATVVGVDIDEAMLEEARRLAAERAGRRLSWVRGRAEDILTSLGHFRVATLGQSLHWMDRDLVLHQLGDAIEDGGGLAILDEGSTRPRQDWEQAALKTAAKYLGRTTRHPMKHAESAHEPSLARSRWFSDFKLHVYPFAVSRDVPSILGWVYSSVSATRAMFGDRLAAFEAELTLVLLNLSPSGVFEDVIETTVYVARKSASPTSAAASSALPPDPG
jgi:2-polyprenyl-3-methyl-5-hydroxy-6-metoxy-1,4-benzoquinol methylase